MKGRRVRHRAADADTRAQAIRHIAEFVAVSCGCRRCLTPPRYRDRNPAPAPCPKDLTYQPKPTTRGVLELAETGPTRDSKISAAADITVNDITMVANITPEAWAKWTA